MQLSFSCLLFARLWPRKPDNPVHVLLQKPSGMDVYNITGIIDKLEQAHGDKDIAIKVFPHTVLRGEITSSLK